MYIETSQNKSGSENVLVSFERTVFFQISYVSFHYSRFSILAKDLLTAMGRFRVRLLIDGNWDTRDTV